jgi:hypothetical protein
MPTIARGNTAEIYVPVYDELTITPGAGGSVHVGVAVQSAADTVAPRTLYAAATISIPGGSTVFAEAIGADATYNSPTGANSPVSGDTVLVAESRTALPSDSGQTLELAASVTYTLSGAVPLPGGVVLMGPASGSATRAVTAGATVGGSTDSATIDARALVALIPRASDATAYEQAGGA